METPGNLLPKTKEILKVILSRSLLAVSKVIQAVNACYDPGKDGYREEVNLFSQVFESNDKKEGTTAFLEKRKPAFTGN